MVGVCQAEQPVDDSLVAAAQGDAARAFEQPVVCHRAAISRYLTREPLLDAFRCLGRLGDDRPFAGRLHRSVRHNLLAAWRRQRRRSAGRPRQRAGRRVPVLRPPRGP